MSLLKPMDNGPQEIRALDGLRALAALSIVAFHTLLTLQVRIYASEPRRESQLVLSFDRCPVVLRAVWVSALSTLCAFDARWPKTTIRPPILSPPCIAHSARLFSLPRHHGRGKVLRAARPF